MLKPVTWLGGVACPPATFRGNVAKNLARGLPEIIPQAPRPEPLYIACAGPSLRDTAEELRGISYPIWALNGAHDYLVGRRAIYPSHGVAQAPEAGVLDSFKALRPGIGYLMASCTHPDLIDRLLAGRVVTLWHCKCPTEWGVDYGDRPQVCGGGTVGLRALDLAWLLGYRDVHCFGFDACQSADGRIGPDLPMYEDRKADVRDFTIHGRTFQALPSHARQVEDYAATVLPLTDLNLTFYGDGLMQWAIRGMNSTHEV